VGTIFGIFKLPERVVYGEKKVTADDVLLPGTELVAAGFKCMAPLPNWS